MHPIRVGVLTISDRCSRGEAQDRSGPAIIETLPSQGFRPVLADIVPDESPAISETLARWCDDDSCDLILTTGGTGFAPRDVTPEATRQVIEREAPALSTHLIIEGLKSTPFAALSRGVAGIRGRTLIVNLPGSPAGAAAGVESLLGILHHAIDVLRSRETDHPVDS